MLTAEDCDDNDDTLLSIVFDPECDGIVCGSLDMDGSGYLAVADSVDWDFGPDDFTVEMWIYPRQASRQALFAFDADHRLGIDYHYAGTRNINIWASSSGAGWNLLTTDSGGGLSGKGSSSMTLNGWHHVALVRSGNRWMSFVDGVLDVDQTIAGSVIDRNENMNFGRWGAFAVAGFNGLMDEIRISSVARYTASGFTPTAAYSVDGDTLALWSMNEMSGASATDSSGNGHTGSLVGVPWALACPDGDGDGATSLVDCDDTDPTLGSSESDGDCDGVLTADDCDDSDAGSTVVSDDADCDGVLTAEDCDDNDDTLLSIVFDPECDGLVCGSLDMDGSGYLSVPESSDWDFGSEDFTVEFWLYPRSANRQALFAFDTFWHLAMDFHYQGTGNANLYASSTGNSWDLLTTDIGGGANSTGAVSMALNAWHHVAFVRSGNTWLSYVDGVQDVSAIKEGSIVSRSEPLNFGTWNGAMPNFNGLMDSIRVSSVARYTSPTFTPTADLAVDGDTLALWSMNELVGNSTTDNSGNGNTGALQDVSWATSCPDEDADGDGFSALVDCDDNDDSIYPRAEDTYNDGVDSDCDGLDCEAAVDGTNYFLVCPDSVTWDTARATCETAGYSLASIRSDPENALIESLGSGLTTYDYYWFGYTDIDSEGVWVWTDGYTGTYTRWSPGEPNNAFDADCASTYNGDRWDDRGCGSTTETEGFVCAYRDADADGIPSTNDCDDTDPAVGSNLDDADCDGASTSVDCDDNDPTLGSTVDDLDCDGAVTAVDCDDLDPLVGTCFSRVGAGGFHSCGIDIAGGVVCWGAGAGESGGDCNVPLRDCGQSTPPPGSFVEVDAGSDLTSCGLELGGTIQCWGYDDFGQATPPAGTFSQVDVGDLHACALDDTGVAVCWGNGVFGTTNPPSGVPLQQLSTSGKHTCAITTDSLVVCWGNNQWGESSPPPGTFLQVSGGSASTCGIRTNGQIACWGRNNVGQSSPPSGAFVQVDQGNGVGCALDQLGEISCWGLNTNGEATPPAGQFTELSVGNGHACAIDSIGALQCWGRNEFNQSTPP